MLDLALGAVGVDDDLGEDVLRVSVAEFDCDQRGDLLEGFGGRESTGWTERPQVMAGTTPEATAGPPLAASWISVACWRSFVA